MLLRSSLCLLLLSIAPCTSFSSPLLYRGTAGRLDVSNQLRSTARSTSTSLSSVGGVLESLPSCTAASATSVALTAGCVGLLSQVALTKTFQRIDSLKDNAAYTAHSVVALGLMGAVSAIGVVGWWFHPLPATAASRLLDPVGPSRWLAAVIAGMFCVWDVPTSLWVKKLRKPDVIIHHVVMAAVAWTGAISLPMHYLFFYLGISEISSIPIVMYDQLSVMTETDENEEGQSEKTNEGASMGKLAKLRDQLQPVAALSFTWIRAFMFTKITLTSFVPDVLEVLPTSGALSGPLTFGMVSSIGFTGLQLYWFSKMLRVIFPGDEKVAAGA